MDNTPGQPGSAPAGTLPRMAMPSAITGWIRLGTLDAQLAALASTMIEHGLPLVVAARSDASAAGWAGPKVRISLGEILLTCALPPATGTHSPAPLTVDAGTLEAVLARMPALSLEAADETGARLALVMVLGVDEHAERLADAGRPPPATAAARRARAPPAPGSGGPRDVGSEPQAIRALRWAVLPELAGLIDRRAGDLDAEHWRPERPPGRPGRPPRSTIPARSAWRSRPPGPPNSVTAQHH